MLEDWTTINWKSEFLCKLCRTEGKQCRYNFIKCHLLRQSHWVLCFFEELGSFWIDWSLQCVFFDQSWWRSTTMTTKKKKIVEPLTNFGLTSFIPVERLRDNLHEETCCLWGEGVPVGNEQEMAKKTAFQRLTIEDDRRNEETESEELGNRSDCRTRFNRAEANEAYDLNWCFWMCVFSCWWRSVG